MTVSNIRVIGKTVSINNAPYLILCIYWPCNGNTETFLHDVTANLSHLSIQYCNVSPLDNWGVILTLTYLQNLVMLTHSLTFVCVITCFLQFSSQLTRHQVHSLIMCLFLGLV